MGISTEIVLEMLSRLDHPQDIEVLPWEEGYRLALEEENILLFSTTRSPGRDPLFKWVGPLVPNNLVFFARKDADLSINTLEEAKKAGRIGVYNDDFGELLLKEKGFQNLVASRKNEMNLPKLITGEIDLWIANELTGKHIIQMAGAADKVEKILDVEKKYMYLAFSRQTPDQVIEKWQKVLDEIKSDGTYSQIFSNWIMFSYTSDLKPERAGTLFLSGKERDWIRKHPVIRVAPDPDYAPFQFRDQNGTLRGLANDYLALIEKKLNIKFEFTRSESWADSLEAMKTRRADMVLVAAKNLERERYMSFTAPYVGFPDMIVTNKNNPEITSLVQLHGKTLATVEGFAINDHIRKYYPGITLAYRPDVNSILKSISTGEYDATVMNIATISYAIEKTKITNLRVDGDTGFTYELSFASRNDWPMLNRVLAKGLKAVTEEERKALLHKWIFTAYGKKESGKKGEVVPLTDEEREWLARHPVITLAPDPNWAPVEFFNDHGQYAGMTADYVALMEKRLGIKFHVLRLDSWGEVIAAATQGRIDVLPAVARTAKRSTDLLFTDVYLNLPSVILVNKKETGPLTMKDLRGKVVSVVDGYAIKDYLEKKYPAIRLDIVSTPEQGLRQVSYGNSYAFIGSIAVTSYIIEKEMLLNLRVAGEAEYTWELSFSTHKNNPLLREIMNKGLDSITKEERQSIFARWILIRKPPWQPTKEQIFGILMITIVLFIISIIIWNRQLARKVKLRTGELAAATSRAETANLAKSEFLAAMSHELRTPLTTVIGAAHLLEGGGLGKRDRHLLNDIRNAGEYLGTLIDDVLNLSSIEQGKTDIVQRPFALPQLLEETVAMLESSARENGVILILRTTDLPEYIQADPIRLRQVITNLVTNAIKYNPKGKVTIAVNVRPPGKGGISSLMVEVDDDGPGIPPALQDVIFLPFERGGKTKDHHRGIGLGLAICNRLIQTMGGTIGLKSEPGRGSRFWFTLPFIPAGGTVAARNRDVYGPYDVLLVEDDDVNRSIISRLLQSEHHRVTPVNDGWTALEMLTGERFDLVLMDVNMPGIDGLETTRRLRTLPGCGMPELPVYALTALVSKKIITLCKEAKLNGVISKPFRPKDLYAVIAGDTGNPFTGKNNVPLIDPGLHKEYAKHLCPEELAELFRLQQNSLEKEEAKLWNAWSEKDLSTIAQAAHKIAGGAAAAGFTALSKTALELEQAAIDGKPQAVGVLLETFRKIKEETRKAF
ncbi:MAG: transporter substrate-binding domain-containing protein [Desulfobacterales bacterium]|nr:transporter substrate-binding domain-containing protein [Desulfobacterales bacterium]